jgi:hypothetical protein
LGADIECQESPACGAAMFLFIVNDQPQGNTKHFAKDGLSFDYAAGWTVTDPFANS